MLYKMRITILMVCVIALNRVHSAQSYEKKFSELFGFIVDQMHPIDRADFAEVIHKISDFSPSQMVPLINFLQFHNISLIVMPTIQAKVSELKYRELEKHRKALQERFTTEQLIDMRNRIYADAQSLEHE